MSQYPVLLAVQEGNVVRVYARDRKGAASQAAQFVNNNTAAPEELAAVIADMGTAFAWLPPEVKPAAKPKEIEGPRRRGPNRGPRMRRSKEEIIRFSETVHHRLAESPTGLDVATLQMMMFGERSHLNANNIRAAIDRLGDRVALVPGSTPHRYEAVRV